MPFPFSPASDLFAGVWLIGGDDALRHYSVLRFPAEADGAFGGSVEILSDPGFPNNQPIIPCSGRGDFSQTAAWGGFMLTLPADCSAEPTTLYLAYQTFGDAGGRWGSTLHATVQTIIDGEVRELDAYWFPPDACDATMTTCAFGAP